jgi:hypothetical protein
LYKNTRNGEENLILSERSFCHGDDAGAFGDERREHGEAIGCVVVQVLGCEAERGEFRHCPAVILVTALAVTEMGVSRQEKYRLTNREKYITINVKK